MAEKTLDQLQEKHSEMLETANDLDIEIPEELAEEITEAGEAGEALVSALDAHIQEGVAKDDKAGQSKASKPKKKAAVKKAVAKTQESEVTASPKKKAVAKKAPAKKKPAAKAKKAAPAKKASAGGKRTVFADEAKITWLAEKNPAREGSGKWNRLEIIRTSSGKTVKTYLSKGTMGTLVRAARKGLAKVA